MLKELMSSVRLRPGMYIIGLIIFFIGVSTGCGFLRIQGNPDKYVRFFNAPFFAMAGAAPYTVKVFLYCLFGAGGIVLLQGICTLNVICASISAIVFAVEGFKTGFTLSALVTLFGFDGFFAIIFCLSSVIILIPLLLYGWVLCYSKAELRFGRRGLRHGLADKTYLKQLAGCAEVALGYSVYCALAAPVLAQNVGGMLGSIL